MKSKEDGAAAWEEGGGENQTDQEEGLKNKKQQLRM